MDKRISSEPLTPDANEQSKRQAFRPTAIKVSVQGLYYFGSGFGHCSKCQLEVTSNKHANKTLQVRNVLLTVLVLLGGRKECMVNVHAV